MNARTTTRTARSGALALLAALVGAAGLAARPASAATASSGAPVTSSVELGIVGPGSGQDTSSSFFATAGGSVSVTSPDVTIATITSIQTFTVTTDLVDTSGDLRPGRPRPKPTYVTTVTPDRTVVGQTPIAVDAGEKVVVNLHVVAPASTPDIGTSVNIAVDDAGAWASIPMHLTVGDVRASLPGYGVVTMKPGTTIVVPITVHSLSGPSTAVTILANVLADYYGIADPYLGVSGAAATVSHGDTVLYVTLTAANVLAAHSVLIRLVAYGTTTTVGGLYVHMVA